jgi:hypothetical protein
MKKILLITIAAFSFLTSSAQMPTLYADSSIKNLPEIQQQIQQALGTDYVYSGIDSLKGDFKTVYGFYFSDAKGNDVAFQYEKFNDKINNPLISGNFRGIMLIWKKYFKHDADERKINETQDDSSGIARIGKQADEWSIFLSR